MLDTIHQTLSSKSRETGVTILYACESGSRAWGFPSPDSDYDVRFIYAHPMEWYLSLFDQRDVIEQPICDLLDISGWDLRKSLGLLYRSNGALLEWLHSPIVYQNTPSVLELLQQLAQNNFQALTLCHHYLGMAKTGWQKLEAEGPVRLKRYFYTLRALGCCHWIISENSIPPVEFPAILEALYPHGEFRQAVDELMHMKMHSNESDSYQRNQHRHLLADVDGKICSLFDMITKNLPENCKKAPTERFDEVFRDILKLIGEHQT